MSQDKYTEYYEILELLEKESNIKESPILYPFDKEEIYNTILERLAQPLPDGSDSPFQDKSPLSAEGILFAQIVFLQELIANEINLIPDAIFYNFYRSLGLLSDNASYSIVQLALTRKETIIGNSSFLVPIGTRFQSRINPEVFLITQEAVLFEQLEGRTKTVPARYSIQGAYQVRSNEFTLIPNNLPNLESISVESVLSVGQNNSNLTTLMIRARDFIRRPGDRIVTLRDYQDKCKELGASKVAIFPKLQIRGMDSFYDNLTTVVVYPTGLNQVIKNELETLIPLGSRIEVIPCRLILLEGIIELIVNRNFDQTTAFNVAATALVENINPPNGNWGDTLLETRIRDIIRQNGFINQNLVIYDVGKIDLREYNTGIKYSELEITPWTLFEIQSSIQFEYNYR